MPLTKITPGSSPQFKITPIPAGITTFSQLTTWIISSDTPGDSVSAFTTSMSEDGLTVTVHIPSTAPLNSGFQLTWRYASPNRTVMEVEAHLTIVAP